MIERNRDLVAFQERLREQCGGKDLVSVCELADAVGVSRQCLSRKLDLPRFAGKVFLEDAAEAIYDKVRPRRKRNG